MIIAAPKLKEITRKFLLAAGCLDDEAEIVADHLVDANLKGHDSHGVGILTLYANSIKNGYLHPNTPARLTNDFGAVLQKNILIFGSTTGKFQIWISIRLNSKFCR